MHRSSKKEGLRDIQYSMTVVLDTKKSNFGSQEWLWFHVWLIMTLYYKIQQILLETVTAILLQNAISQLRKTISLLAHQNS